MLPSYAIFELCFVGPRFSSEIYKPAVQWIQDNFNPRELFSDMLARPEDKLPTFCEGYITGFPCQPFSRMNAKAKNWADKRARVPKKMVRALLHTGARWGIFENVVGLLKHKGKFVSMLARMGVTARYHCFLIPLCPAEILKEPIRRTMVQPNVGHVCARVCVCGVCVVRDCGFGDVK